PTCAAAGRVAPNSSTAEAAMVEGKVSRWTLSLLLRAAAEQRREELKKIVSLSDRDGSDDEGEVAEAIAANNLQLEELAAGEFLTDWYAFEQLLKPLHAFFVELEVCEIADPDDEEDFAKA